MVTTFETAPAPALAPYVHRYVYREFTTGGADIIKPWVASLEASLFFFFRDLPVQLTDPLTGKILKKGQPCDVQGMSSQYNGDMHFNGSYAFFQVIFKPHGFYRLFGIPSSYLINQIVCSEDMFDRQIKLLHEQLYEAKGALQMAARADMFLLSYLKKQRLLDDKNGISHAIHIIERRAGYTNVDALARDVNMSTRNFERLFQLATGMPPKLLCCITRFNHALHVKLQNFSMDWTSVAYKTGYFDQMHLIKDFKRFSGSTPKSLLKDVFLFEEEHTLM